MLKQTLVKIFEREYLLQMAEYLDASKGLGPKAINDLANSSASDDEILKAANVLRRLKPVEFTHELAESNLNEHEMVLAMNAYQRILKG